MNRTENVQPISTYDEKGLTKYFGKNLRDPGETIVWKLIGFGYYLLDHKNPIIRWVSFVPCLLFGGCLFLFDRIRSRLTKKSA